MLKLLKNGFKTKEVRNKILFTLFILLVFRLGAHITVPGIDASKLQQVSGMSFFNMLSLVSGNALQNFSIFSMGVSPYITASIIIQLLQMDIIPKFVEWSKQGETGRRKLNQATRYLTLVLGFVQSISIVGLFNNYASAGIVKTPNFKTYLTIGLILTAGSMFVNWLGEQITENGLGNGVSMIIFAGIVSSLPTGVKQIVEDYFINISKSEIGWSILFVVLLVLAILIVVTITTWVQQAERKIPIQYTKRANGAPQSSYMPLKVNAAGVIPVIFASSLVTLPATVLNLFASKSSDETWYAILSKLFNYNTLPGGTLYAVLIVLFTFFYAFVQVNPEKVAENLQKQGSYVPSIRPGKGTEEYISGVLKRLSTVGSIFLAAVAILPIIAANLWSLPSSIGLGGTSLLIIISTALDTSKQLEGLMMKRQYTGFINK